MHAHVADDILVLLANPSPIGMQGAATRPSE